MARRSLLKMYNKVLDNMEGVQSPLHHNNYVNSKVSNPESDDTTYSTERKCVSSYDVNNKYYHSDNSVYPMKEHKKIRKDLTPLRSDSNPYVTPKFTLRRKEELPSVTPHWSNTKGLELKESVPTVLKENEYTAHSYPRTHNISKLGRGSPRVPSTTDIGPYTPPQFFFSPKKYMETSKKDDILVSIDNKVPPSLQSWAKQKIRHHQANQELQDISRHVELGNSTHRTVREQRAKETYKAKPLSLETRSKKNYNADRHDIHDEAFRHRGVSTINSFQENSQSTKHMKHKDKQSVNPVKTIPSYNTNRVNEINNTSIRKCKKIYERARGKDAVMSAPSCGNETWRNMLDFKMNEKLNEDDNQNTRSVYGNEAWRQKTRQDKAVGAQENKEGDKKNVYGNEAWRNTIIVRNKEAKQAESETSKPKKYSASPSEQRATSERTNRDSNFDSVYDYRNSEVDSTADFDDPESLKADNKMWEDIEPFLPSFLSTVRETREPLKKPAAPVKPAKAPEPEQKELKKEAKPEEVKPPPPTTKTEALLTRSKRAYRCLLNSMARSKENQEGISLFKHFQTRSKMLRKQHSMLGKKKVNFSKNKNKHLSAKNVIRYYASKDLLNANEPEKKQEEPSSYRPGTVCDIDDDGFKTSQSDESFSFWQSGNKCHGFDNMFGYEMLFTH